MTDEDTRATKGTEKGREGEEGDWRGGGMVDSARRKDIFLYFERERSKYKDMYHDE